MLNLKGLVALTELIVVSIDREWQFEEDGMWLKEVRHF